MKRQAVGLMRALLARSDATQQLAAAVSCGALAGVVAPAAACWRAFSSPPATSNVPPAATRVDITQEWYNRQRQIIPLGNRMPDTAVGAYISPSAVVVGDVDILDRVSCLCTRACRDAGCACCVNAEHCGCARTCCILLRPASQASIWNHVVLRGDINNITIGHVSNIQDRSVIHAARCAVISQESSTEVHMFGSVFAVSKQHNLVALLG